MTRRPESVRLLPWASPEGKPCFLVGDGNGCLSRVADNIEAIQLGMGADLIDRAADVVDDPTTPAAELRLLAAGLAQALSDALRVAESRGGRLAEADDALDDGPDHDPDDHPDDTPGSVCPDGC